MQKDRPKAQWKLATSDEHCIDVGIVWSAFGIDPYGFKKPRHAKKFFKKYLRPILLRETS